MRNTIEKHNKPGVMGLFGLPFLLAGCFFLFQVFNPEANWTNGDRPFFIVIPLCSIFILLGLFILAGRSGYIIDPLAGRASTYVGLIIPLYYKRIRLSKVDHILIEKELRRSKNSSYYIYKTYFVLKDKKKVHLNENRIYLLERERAERIGRECSLNLLNKVEGDKLIPYDQIDKEFVEKVKQKSLELPKVPNHSKVNFNEQGTKNIITNKNKDSLVGKLIPFFFASIFLIPFIFIFGSFFDKAPTPLKIFVPLFFAIPSLSLLFKALFSYTTSLSITVTGKDLFIEKEGFYNKSERIEFEEIDDIEGFLIDGDKEDKSSQHSQGISLLTSMFGANNLKIISKTGLHVYGPFANPEDLNYTRELIAYSINRLK